MSEVRDLGHCGEQNDSDPALVFRGDLLGSGPPGHGHGMSWHYTMSWLIVLPRVGCDRGNLGDSEIKAVPGQHCDSAVVGLYFLQR